MQPFISKPLHCIIYDYQIISSSVIKYSDFISYQWHLLINFASLDKSVYYCIYLWLLGDLILHNLPILKILNRVFHIDRLCCSPKKTSLIYLQQSTMLIMILCLLHTINICIHIYLMSFSSFLNMKLCWGHIKDNFLRNI